jgi:hypothetical protein
MQQLPGSQYRLQFGLKGWATIVVGLAIFIAVATFLAIGFFFVVLPMIVLAPIIYYFTPRKAARVMTTSETMRRMRMTGEEEGGTIIDGEYRVIEGDPDMKS